MLSKTTPQLFFTDDKGQVSNENGRSKIFPRIDLGIAAGAWNLCPLSHLALIFLRAARVYAQMFFPPKGLIEFFDSFWSGKFVFVKNVGIFGVFIFTPLLLDNLGSIWSLRIFLIHTDRAEPNFFNFSNPLEQLCQLFCSSIQRHITHKNGPLSSFFDLKSTQVLFINLLLFVCIII